MWIKTFKDEKKIEKEMANYRRKCMCGHTVIALPASKNHKDYVICNWCGQKVYKDDNKQLEYEEQVKRENFRMKMRGML